MQNLKILLTSILCCSLCGCSFTNKNYIQKLIDNNSYSYQDSSYPKDAIEIAQPTALKITGHVP
jgi:hypothetical protein